MITYIKTDVNFLKKVIENRPPMDSRIKLINVLIKKQKVLLDDTCSIFKENEDLFKSIFPNTPHKEIKKLLNIAVKVIIRCVYKDQFDYMIDDEKYSRKRIKKSIELSNYKRERVSLFNISITMWLAHIGKNILMDKKLFDKPKNKPLFLIMNNIQNYRSEALIYRINDALRLLSVSICEMNDDVDKYFILYNHYYDFLQNLFDAEISYEDGIDIMEVFLDKMETLPSEIKYDFVN